MEQLLAVLQVMISSHFQTTCEEWVNILNDLQDELFEMMEDYDEFVLHKRKQLLLVDDDGTAPHQTTTEDSSTTGRTTVVNPTISP